MGSSTKPPTPCMDNIVLALDFGGTKLAAAVVDLEKGKIVTPVIRQQTPVSEGGRGTLKAMVECGNKAIDAFGQLQLVKAVGISFGGPVSSDRKSVLRSIHVSDWDNVALVDEISRAFRLPAAMDNDGNVAALGEWRFGGYYHFDNVAYVQASTGVGGGFVLGRQPYRGSGLAAEIGHYLIDVNGPQCMCGRKGCLESICSGWAISRDGREALLRGDGTCPTLKQLSQNKPEWVNAEMVFEACRALDPACVTIVHRALDGLALMITNLVTSLDPQVVVISGGLTRSREIFESYFIPVVHDLMHPFFKERCKIEFSTLDGDALLLGAALLTQEK